VVSKKKEKKKAQTHRIQEFKEKKEVLLLQ
jgi:hypothetical protein